MDIKETEEEKDWLSNEIEELYNKFLWCSFRSQETRNFILSQYVKYLNSINAPSGSHITEHEIALFTDFTIAKYLRDYLSQDRFKDFITYANSLEGNQAAIEIVNCKAQRVTWLEFSKKWDPSL